MELEWSFDFRPSNMLIETMQLEVMQNDPESQIFDKYLVNVDSITWYVHIGLTKDVINYSYVSTKNGNKNKVDHRNKHPHKEVENDESNNNTNDKTGHSDKLNSHDEQNHDDDVEKEKMTTQEKNYKLCILKKTDVLTDNRHHFDFKKSKKPKNKYSLHKLDKGIHFNDIPVVDYDENINNSFLWQKIPENDEYYNEIYNEIDNVDNVDNMDNDNDNNNNNNNNDDDDDDNNNNNNGDDHDNNTENNNNNNTTNKKERPKFNWVNLSKSAYEQYGFILKAVIKGKIYMPLF